MEKQHHQRLQLRVLSHPVQGTFFHVAPGQLSLPVGRFIFALVSSLTA